MSRYWSWIGALLILVLTVSLSALYSAAQRDAFVAEVHASAPIAFVAESDAPAKPAEGPEDRPAPVTIGTKEPPYQAGDFLVELGAPATFPGQPAPKGIADVPIW